MIRFISFFLIFISLNYNTLADVQKHIIESKILGYNIRYWVYVPNGNNKELPVLYVTDGKGYKDRGDIVGISKSLLKKNVVEPHIIVMIDANDPDIAGLNRRNSQFLCNPKYLRFYIEELVPQIESRYKTLKSSEDRGILGLSFGGLNAMYFALHASETFGQIGIQSPAPHPCPDIYSDFETAKKLPIDIFLSTGIVNDKAKDTRRFKRILDKKGYNFEYIEVPEGHNWRNWKPLLDDVLIHFYGIKKGEAAN